MHDSKGYWNSWAGRAGRDHGCFVDADVARGLGPEEAEAERAAVSKTLAERRDLEGLAVVVDTRCEEVCDGDDEVALRGDPAEELYHRGGSPRTAH